MLENRSRNKIQVQITKGQKEQSVVVNRLVKKKHKLNQKYIFTKVLKTTKKKKRTENAKILFKTKTK